MGSPLGVCPGGGWLAHLSGVCPEDGSWAHLSGECP